MKITLNFSQFCDNWPESRKNQFSYEAKRAIFNYLEELEQDTGEEAEFDPIAICCDFAEYDSEFNAVKDYTDEFNDIRDNDERQEQARQWLEERTLILQLDNGGIVIQNF